MPEKEMPLVTLVLIAYNQERFIKEAVESVLSQVYPHLEVIISDDASTDRTFDIASDVAREYRGPHRLRLRRNEQNLGLIPHVNQLMILVETEFVVLAAGDDISLPQRVGVLVDAWLSAGKPPALCSRLISIDSEGNEYGNRDAWARDFETRRDELGEEALVRLIRTGVPALIGCTEAWTSQLFEIFPPLEVNAWAEDKAIAFRALIKGDILFLPNKLVKYRSHESNLCNYQSHAPVTIAEVEQEEFKTLEEQRRDMGLLDSYRSDLLHSVQSSLMEADQAARIMDEIEAQRKIIEQKLIWWDSPISTRISQFLRLMQKRSLVGDYLWYLRRLLPFGVFVVVKSFYMKVWGSKRWTRILAERER